MRAGPPVPSFGRPRSDAAFTPALARSVNLRVKRAHGVQAMSCASGEDVVTNPTQAIAWDKYAATHNVAIPVYEDDGTTVIGTFVVGEPKPGVQTVLLATSGQPCAANPPQPPHTIEPPPPSTTG